MRFFLSYREINNGQKVVFFKKGADDAISTTSL